MERSVPKPLMTSTCMRVGRVPPEKLTRRLTPVDHVFELSSMGIPAVCSHSWTLDITGLVDRSMAMSFEELLRFPKRTVESAFVCSGDPRRPTTPLRRVANVKWGGVDLAELLSRVGVRREATHLWSYGQDHGEFFGVPQHHYVKDMPLARLTEGSVLIAYELNDAPLTPRNGFPVRLVIPRFYGTNCVKWLCRLDLRERRASDFITTSLYSDPDFDVDPSGRTTKPVWAVAPESIIVSLRPESRIGRKPTEIWGWAWSNCPVQSVDISTDGSESWSEASLESPRGLSWQRFSYMWLPSRAGRFNVCCRATDTNGRTQPVVAARNAVHSIPINVGA